MVSRGRQKPLGLMFNQSKLITTTEKWCVAISSGQVAKLFANCALLVPDVEAVLERPEHPAAGIGLSLPLLPTASTGSEGHSSQAAQFPQILCSCSIIVLQTNLLSRSFFHLKISHTYVYK